MCVRLVVSMWCIVMCLYVCVCMSVCYKPEGLSLFGVGAGHVTVYYVGSSQTLQNEYKFASCARLQIRR